VRARSALLVVVVAAACAPAVDGPTERQRAGDRADAARLTAQLDALPGVVRAEVLLRRPVRDPLAPTLPPAASPACSIVVIVDDKADREAIARAARALALIAAPGLEPVLVVELGATRPELAKLGPFTVEASSRGPLRAAIGIALALILALASWIAWRERRGRI
jgi:hypothetical protein